MGDTRMTAKPPCDCTQHEGEESNQRAGRDSRCSGIGDVDRLLLRSLNRLGILLLDLGNLCSRFFDRNVARTS